MAPTDWDEIMDSGLDDLEGDAADSMFELLAEFDPGGEEDPARLQKLFAVTQTIMLVKGTQSELAEEQLAQMAEEEGKGTAKRDEEYQDLRLEVQQLRQENKDLKRFGTDTPGATTGSASRDMRFVREELSEMEHQISLLQRDLKEKERQLSDEITASERLAQRAEDAERISRDLKRENEQFQDDIRDYQRQLETQRDAMLSKRDDDVQFRDKITSKNKFLNAALEENRLLGEANVDLEEKLKDMKQRLLDAQEEMDKTTTEFLQMKLVVSQSDSLMENLRRQKDMLQAQVEDLQEQVMSKGDADDEIMVIVNNKVEEWKGILADKDDEITRLQGQVVNLNERLIAANIDSEKASVAALTKALEERDKKITTLKLRVEEASSYMEANAALMDDVRSEMSKGTSKIGESTLKKVKSLQTTVQDKEELYLEAETRAKQAEEDAVAKDKELSEALERMQQYESGEYGLAEAVAEIKAGKTKLNIRDRQIEELTQHINKVEMKVNDMYDENDSLRERLGLDLQEPIDVNEFRNKKNARQQEERALNRVLQKEVERLEEERIALKQQNRSLAQAAGKRAVALGLDADDLLSVDVVIDEMKSRKMAGRGGTGGMITGEVERDDLRLKNVQLDHEVGKTAAKMEKISSENAQLRAKNKELLDENGNLHQGMKEINVAIKEQGQASRGDGSDIKIIECPTLDRMLAAIDAKSLVGSYDTSLYLKAQVDNLTGHNEELRSELRETRFETTKARVELDKTKQKTEVLQAEVTSLREIGAGGNFQAMPLPEGMAVTSSEVIASLNEHVIQLLQDLSQKEETIQSTEAMLEKFKRQFAVVRHQQSLVYQEYTGEKKTWISEKENMQKTLNQLQGSQEDDKVRIQEFDRLIDTLAQDDVEVRRRLAETTRKITVLRVNEKALSRRYNAMQEMEGNSRKENTKLKSDMISMECAVEERLGYLQRFKDMASFKIATLQKDLDNAVPMVELEKANRQFTELTEKYRDILEKSNTLVIKQETTTGFEMEAQRLEKESAELKSELGVEKEKLHVLEAAFENMRKQGVASNSSLSDSDVISISKKLTTLEMKELNERQRAEHASRMYEQQKSQLRGLEDRNMELETKFAELTRMNLEAQKVERELRDDLANSITKAVSDADRKRIAHLEKNEATLRDENTKLKDIAEIATIQSMSLDAQQVSRDKEVLSLRQQLLDFQSQSDEKTVIGKLHRQIVHLQVSEGTAVRHLQNANKKLVRLEAQLLRLEHRMDDKDSTIYNNRLESRSKSKYLKHTIQELRRKFSGAIPLKQQEKFAEAMLEMQQDRAKMEESLRKVNDERHSIEDQLQAVELQKKGAEELIATLKDGKGAQKVAEWHSKMESVRLEDLRYKRQIERLKQQMAFLEGIIKKHEVEVLRLEEDRIRAAKEFESRELDWEQREVELERIIHNMERTQAEIAGAASQFEVAVNSLPDPAWPVAKQLEHAVETIKKNIKLIMDAKGEIQVLKKNLDDKDIELKEKNKDVTSRDRVITELRLRLPASAERDQAIAKATATASRASFSSAVQEDYEAAQAVNVAQSTVASLQARLNQKDETLNKYQELLRQARVDMAQANKRHAQETEVLQQKLHAKHDAAFSKFKTAAIESVSKPSATLPSNDQLKRLNELEDIVADQDNSLSAIRHKLTQARQEIQNLKIQNDDTIRAYDKEKTSLIEHYQNEIDDVIRQLRDLQAEYDAKVQELQVTEAELDTQKAANSRAPTKTMKDLVERLKNQLSLKEKQHQALSRALTELRGEMVAQAQDEVKAHADQTAAEFNVQKMVDKQTKELKENVEDLNNEIDKLRKDAKKYKIHAESSSSELDEVRADFAKKENQVRKLKEDKARFEAEVEQLERKVERMSTMAKQRGVTEGAQNELDELRRKNRLLADELKRIKHRPEKPYEQTAGKDKDDKTGEEAVARWEESKKWQKMVDRLKSRLKDREADLERLTKAHEMTKNVLERANRDKENLEHKLRIASKATPAPPAEYKKDSSGKSHASSHEMETLKKGNYELLEENTRLKRELMESHDKVVEEVQLRNKFLQERLDTLEQQVAQRQQGSQPMGVSQDEYRDLAKKEQKLQKDIIRLSEENIELKFEVESARKDIPRLKERIEDLQQYVAILKQEKDTILQSARSLSNTSLTSSGSNVRRIGESGRSVRELEKTVSLLKKVIERSQAENQKLKSASGVVSNEQVLMLQRENEGLKEQLNEVRQAMGATLDERHTSQQKGTAKIMADHDRLRKDLLKEKEQNESLRLKIRQQEVSIEQLRKDLADSKTKLEIEAAKHPSGGSADTKGWKSAVVTRMYEGKLKALEEDVEKKNKMLGDVKVLLREAAGREQQLMHERSHLQQKLEILSDVPGDDSQLARELQQTRLEVDRLKCEKKELMNALNVLHQQLNKEGKMDVSVDELLHKFQSHDELLGENVEVSTQLRAAVLEKEQLAREVEKLKRELSNFGPEFFEEIEDLKFNYREAVQKNVQYEEQLTQISKQFGVEVNILSDSTSGY